MKPLQHQLLLQRTPVALPDTGEDDDDDFCDDCENNVTDHTDVNDDGIGELMMIVKMMILMMVYMPDI